MYTFCAEREATAPELSASMTSIRLQNVARCSQPGLRATGSWQLAVGVHGGRVFCKLKIDKGNAHRLC